jgi:copper transport protein
LVRFGAFAANAILFGLVPVLLLVIRPALRGAGGSEWNSARRTVAGRLERLVRGCLVASLVATSLTLVLQAAAVAEFSQADVDASFLTAVLDTPFGMWLGMRLPLLLALSFLLVQRVRQWSVADAGHETPAAGPVWWGTWLLLSAALLATSSFSGHAAAASPKWAAIVCDVVHLAAGATWFTGVVALAAVVPYAAGHREGLEGIRVLAPAVNRFSEVALVSIGIVAVSGTLNSLLHVASFGDLVDSGYGRVLSVKLVVFSVIFAHGGTNHILVRQRLMRAMHGDESPRVQRLFRKTIVAELVGAIAIMALTGLLVGLAPTRNSSAPAHADAGRESSHRGIVHLPETPSVPALPGATGGSGRDAALVFRDR